MNLGHSLAVLATDEDLMERLILANDVASFVGAIDARLNDLIVIPSTSFANLQAAKFGPPHPMDLMTIKEEFAGPPKILSKRNTNTSIALSEFSNVSSNNQTTDTTCLHKLSGYKKLVIKKLQQYSLPLVFGVLTALVWSNVDDHSYHEFTHNAIIKGAKILGYDLSLHFIVNDFFMCFFFGLAIKEVTEAVLPGGSLYPITRAVNPLMGTMGGILGPIVVYIICVLVFDAMGTFDETMCVVQEDERRRLGGGGASSSNGPKEVCELSVIIKGWGVPTATDISLAWMFALMIFGAGHPAINVLLLLAIVDDAIGILIIAVFYPDPDNPVVPAWLGLVVVAIAVAFGLRVLKVSHWQAYVVLAGPISWFGLIKAHVHPALALVVVVPLMPDKLKPRHNNHHHSPEEPDSPGLPVEQRTSGFSAFRRMARKVAALLGESETRAQKKTATAVADILSQLHSAPLHAFEHALKLPVDLGMFFFGLANAGVQMGSVGGVTAAVLIALLLGKTIGIAGCSLVAVKCGFNLPAGISVVDVFAFSALGGVGLTVALFVSNEAFSDPGLQGQAKMGAVLSVGGALLAWFIKFFGDMFFGGEEEISFDDESLSDEGEEVDVPIAMQNAWGSPEADSNVDDHVLVEDILQVMWTVRKYKLHGSDLPFTEQAVRSSSKLSCSGRGSMRMASKPMRMSSKQSVEGRGSKIVSCSSNSSIPETVVEGEEKPQAPQMAWNGPGLEEP
jgi:NhaA family Na+:H+ antiporter